MLAVGRLLEVVGLILIAIVGYAVVGWVYDRVSGNKTSAPETGLCPDPNCRHFNGLDADYCARCGRPLNS